MSEEVVKSIPKALLVTDFKMPNRICLREDHLRPLFNEIVSQKCSDVYIIEGMPIYILVKGRMRAITERAIDRTEAQWLLAEIAGGTAISSISSQKAVNTTFSIFDIDENKKNSQNHRARNSFRVNVSAIRIQGVSSFQIVLRSIPDDPPRYDEVGMDEDFVKKFAPAKGIVIVGGATGEGKSTTLASSIRYILENNTVIKGNFVTHEEPIEYTYDNIHSEHSIVAQSQIPECFLSFEDANREAMRRKPSGILIGELRDKSTINSAVEASLTGHPTFATVHAGSVVEIIRRMLSKYSFEEKTSALYDILSTVHLLVAQRLVRKKDGNLFAVREWLMITNEMREEILNISDPLLVYGRINFYLKEAEKGEVSYASQSFATQGRILLESGVIGEDGYEKLRA